MTSVRPALTAFGRGSPLRRGLKRSEEVARDIVATLLERRWPVGTVLPTETQMREQYEVGRTTLREALRILEVYGLITVRPGKSGGPRLGSVGAADFGRSATFYYAMGGVTFGELSEARLALEPIMARLAAQRRTDVEATDLDELVRRAQANEDPVESVKLSLAFHAKVGDISGNRALALISGSFEEISRLYSTESLEAHVRHEVVHVHDRIARAIREGDQDQAERLMRKHMQESGRDFERRNPTLGARVVDWI